MLSQRDKSSSTAIVQDGRKIITSTRPDGSECIEELDLNTLEILGIFTLLDDTCLQLVRKIRRKNTLGAFGSWEYEIGEAPKSMDSFISLNSSNPYVYRKDTKTHFMWRIRNAIWAKDVYQLSIDSNDNKIVLKTANKKYYTRINVPDMDILGLKLDSKELTYDWGANTLVILYKKPKLVLDEEETQKKAKKAMNSSDASRDGDVDCKQS